MNIIVGIPSLNEVDSIAFVAERLDEGVPLVQARFSSAKVTLVNVDSSSSDGTADRFLSANVRHAAREVIVVPEQPGKGRNLLALFRYAAEKSASAIITVDADITSITNEWLFLLSVPVLGENADLVIPRYERNRYEGSTTNHFAFPLVSIVAGFPVRQPIGGDFGISPTLARRMLDANQPPGGDLYGIDIWLALTAGVTGCSITSCRLGRKLHKPSFNKLTGMFPQIASCTLSLLRQWEWRPAATDISWQVSGTDIVPDTYFSHESAARQMLGAAVVSTQELLTRGCAWVPDVMAEEIKYLIRTESAPNPELWAALLSRWLVHGLKQNAESDAMGAELLPFFTWRSVSFWFESRAMTGQEIEQYLARQASSLHAALLNELTT